MNYQQLFRVLIAAISIVGLFYLGYLFGSREKYNSQPDNITLTATNGARKNYLTQIERRVVFGAVNSGSVKTPQVFGEMLFIQESSNETQILLALQNVPATTRNADGSKEKLIPANLEVLLATRNTDGTDFIYESIGQINFDAPDKTNQRTGKFSTTIPRKLYNTDNPTKSVQRIEFRPQKIEDENIFTLDNADLPINARQRKAAYFWVNL
jgi:hypothetical protein